jgi:hypothetical protein
MSEPELPDLPPALEDRLVESLARALVADFRRSDAADPPVDGPAPVAVGAAPRRRPRKEGAA